MSVSYTCMGFCFVDPVLKGYVSPAKNPVATSQISGKQSLIDEVHSRFG